MSAMVNAAGSLPCNMAASHAAGTGGAGGGGFTACMFWGGGGGGGGFTRGAAGTPGGCLTGGGSLAEGATALLPWCGGAFMRMLCAGGAFVPRLGTGGFLACEAAGGSSIGNGGGAGFEQAFVSSLGSIHGGGGFAWVATTGGGGFACGAPLPPSPMVATTAQPRAAEVSPAIASSAEAGSDPFTRQPGGDISHGSTALVLSLLGLGVCAFSESSTERLLSLLWFRDCTSCLGDLSTWLAAVNGG